VKRSAPMKRSALRRDTGEARLTVKPLRARKCKAPGCGERYTPSRPLQQACSAMCAVAVGQQNRLKQDRAQDKATRERLMTLSDWRKRAQAAFNGWTKARDAALPCISCGAPPRTDDQAGHYLTRGAHPELAMDPANTHRQCLRCNLFLHGAQAKYRIGLVERIGLAEVERLEGPNPPRKDTADSLKALAAHYREQTRALKKAT
jgi:hypothetical protein